MTNREAIEIVEDMIESELRLYPQEEKALYQLIQTAKDYNVLTGIIGICGE